MKNGREQSPLMLCLLSVLTTVMVIVVILAKRQGRQINTVDYMTPPANTLESPLEKWQEGVIEYDGKQYKYNSNLKIYLLMGVDKNGVVETAEDYTSGGQSDANFLLVADPDKMELSVFSINRNTMTDVVVYTEYGDILGTSPQQLCLQHAYGDGRKLSCNLSMSAVSKLFNNIPIDGYMAINMGGIPALNDSIGGVEVEVLPGAKDFNEGEHVNLMGKQAYDYLHDRDVDLFNSASLRQKRHEQYINAYLQKVKDMRSQGFGASAVASMYDSVVDYMVSSVDFTSLVSELLEYEYDDSRMYIVPGEMKQGELWEEYIVDDEDFYDMIIQVFYTEADN